MVATIAVAGGTSSRAQEVDRVRVIEIVLDGLHPDLIGPSTPNLQALKDGGTWYEQHRSVMASETLPNHVAMATGTYPERNGIPNNGGRIAPGDQAEADPDLRAPSNRTAESLVQVIERVCPELRTVTVFSKAYVHHTFAEDGADSDFDQPTFNVPESDHALDATTGTFILAELAQNDPAYLFANLGDVDRAGHIDVTGWTGTPAAHLAAIAQADTLVGVFVAQLQARGMWEDTVLIINSDHSMDWVPPLVLGEVIEPDPWLGIGDLLEAEPSTAGKFFATTEGGTAQIYLREPTGPTAHADMKAAMDHLSGVEGIREVMYREPNPLDPGKDVDTLHPDWHAGTHRLGELFAVMESGYRSTAFGSSESLAAPGYHGHAETRHATMMITGGWDGLVSQSIPPSNPSAVDPYDDTAALPEQSEQVDIAPTIGWLLGVPDPGLSRGEGPQWQGRVLAEAFERQPDPVCIPDAGHDGGVAPVPAPQPDDGDGGSAPMPATGGGMAVLGLLAAMAAVRARRR